MFSRSVFRLFVFWFLAFFACAQPHLDGVFYELYTDVATWDENEWRQEFQSMKDIGIKYVAFRTIFDAWYPNYTSPPPPNESAMDKEHDIQITQLYSQLSMRSPNPHRLSMGDVSYIGLATDNCPYGVFTAFYPSQIDSECVRYIGTNVVKTLLTIGDELSIDIHLGLPFPLQSGGDDQWWYGYGQLSIDVFNEIYSQFHNYQSLVGIYTVFEVGNYHSSLLMLSPFIHNFIRPVSDAIKSVSPSYLVWGSPYYRHISEDPINDPLLTPAEYGDFWATVFENAPSFDLIAPQDGVGASNNTVHNYTYVIQYLSALVQVSETALPHSRQIWSNAEAFQFIVWHHGTNCDTIESAPFARFMDQMSIECGMAIDSLLSWEYHAYMSPYCNTCDPYKSALAAQFYSNYSAYINSY